MNELKWSRRLRRRAFPDRQNRKLDRPNSLTIGASALLLAAILNGVGTVLSVFSLFRQGYEASVVTLILVVLVVVGALLIGVPLWAAVGAFRGWLGSAFLAIFFVVAQILAALQNSAWNYVAASIALVAVVLLRLPASRRFFAQVSASRARGQATGSHQIG